MLNIIFCLEETNDIHYLCAVKQKINIMKQYNLSEIMKRAHNLYRNTNKYTWSEALKKSWKMAKFNKEVEARRAETIAYNEAKKQAEMEKAAWVAQVESGVRRKQEEVAKVEAECRAYGYGLGNHYSAFSGWGNYCGD